MAIPVTFLQLAQKTHELSGIQGSGPAAVTGNPDMYQKIVTWVADAWVTIQNARKDWRFLRVTFAVPITTRAAEHDLTAAPFSWTNFSSFDQDSLTLNTTGQTDLQYLKLRDYRDFRMRYAALTMTSARPSALCQPSATKIRFNTILDADYDFRGDYWRSPQVLAASGEEPLLPLEHRMLIVYEALKTIAADRGTGDLREFANREYGKLYPKMCASEAELPSAFPVCSLLGPDVM
jgi:hypothetical protein